MRSLILTALASSLSAGALARPDGLASFLHESFERFTPGSPISGAAPGCPTWNGGFTAASVGTGIAARAPAGVNSMLSATLPNRFAPDQSDSVVCEVDCFIESIAPSATVNFWQPSSGPAGLRVVWGGVNTVPGACPGFPNTIGAWVNVHAVLSCGSPSNPRFLDTGVAVPVGAWFRLTIQSRSDGVIAGWLDRLDGAAPAPLFEEFSLASGSVDTIGFSNSATGAGAMLVDRVIVRGPSARPPCPADATRDGRVNFADLNLVLSQYGLVGAPGTLAGDVDGDGAVTFADLNAVLSAYGATCACA